MDYPHVSLDKLGQTALKALQGESVMPEGLSGDLGEIGKAALRAYGGGTGFGQQYDAIQQGKAQAAEKAQNTAFKQQDMQLRSQDAQLRKAQLIQKAAENAASRGDKEAKVFLDAADRVLKGVEDPIMRAKFMSQFTAAKPTPENVYQVSEQVASSLGLSGKEKDAPAGYQWNANRTQLTAIPGGPADKPADNKPPAGYRWTPAGDLEAIPGGPSDKPEAAPPAGYLWNADRTGLIAIPGGPADKSTEIEKPPAGYRTTPDGNLEAIPGGPADRPDKPTALRKVFDTETKSLAWASDDDIRSNPGKYIPPPTGMKVSSDGKGGFTFTTGDMASEGPEQSSTRNTIEGKKFDAIEMRSRLSGIREKFNPEYLTLGGKAGMMWSEMKDRISEIDESEKVKLRDFSSFKRRTIDNVNKTLNELSGAAVSPQEAIRIRNSLPDGGDGLFDGDSPTVFKAKLDDTLAQLNAAIKRYESLGENWKSKPLDEYLEKAGGVDPNGNHPVGTVIDDGTGEWIMTTEGWKRK